MTQKKRPKANPETQNTAVIETEGLPSRKVKAGERYNENPFLDAMIVQTRDKRLTVARGSHIVDLGTGEVEGVTEIAQVIQVDREQFVKLFVKDLATWFDLTKTAQKTLVIVMRAMAARSINRDTLILDWDESFGQPKASFFRGVHELIEQQVMARAKLPGLYYVNPALIFNGDRARFIKEYRVRKTTPPDVKAREELEAHGQGRLIE